MLALALTSRATGAVHAAAVSRPAVFLGGISYSVYLVHGSVFVLLDTTANAIGLAQPVLSLLLLVAGAPLSVASGLILHKTIELPTIARAHQRAPTVPLAAPAAPAPAPA